MKTLSLPRIATTLSVATILSLSSLLVYAQENNSLEKPRLTQEQRTQIREAFQSGGHEAVQELLQEFGMERPEFRRHRRKDGSPEKQAMHQAVKKALTNNDYDAFVGAAQNTPLAEKITPENFDTFVALHQAKENGDQKTAKALAQELGIEKLHSQKHQVPSDGVRAALEAQDYIAFQRAIKEDGKLREVITSEVDFQRMVALHQAIESGDMQTAEEIRIELGLPDHRQSYQKEHISAEDKAAMQAAIERGDYTAWAAIAPEKLTERVSQENFYLLQELNIARTEQDGGRVKEIVEELGLRPHKHKR